MRRWHCRHVCRISSKTLDMTFYGLVEMIKGDFADMGGRQTCQVCAGGERGPTFARAEFL